MEIDEVFQKNKKEMLKKCFIDKYGYVYSTGMNGMHEMLAMKICEAKGWNDWINYYDLAEGFLLHRKGFIKVADYEDFGDEFHYVLISENYKKNKQIKKNAEFIANMLGVKFMTEEDLRRVDNSFFR